MTTDRAPRAYTLRPTELPHVQRVLAAWWTSPYGLLYAQGFMEDTRRPGGTGGNTGMFHEDARPVDLARIESQRVLMCEPYWISEEMLAVAEHAALTMPLVKLYEDMLPTTTGFAYFAAPRFSRDAHDRLVNERLVVWSSTVSMVKDRPWETKLGAAVSWYSGRDDDDDYHDARYVAADRNRDRIPQFTLLHTDFWPYDTVPGRYATRPNGEDLDLDTHPEHDWRRFLLATWQLLKQPIARSTRVEPSRQMIKQARRARQPVHPVRVITLRREVDRPDEEHGGGELASPNWRSRWIVRGHWRKLHQMTKDGRVVTWVNPYVKGPEGLPLRFSDHVYKWTR